MWFCVLYYVVGSHLFTVVLGFPPKNNSDNDLPTCGLNEVATSDKIVCPPQTCDSMYRFYSCSDTAPVPGCDCIDGYLRNASGICIFSDECPPSPILPVCGLNEIPTTDKTMCPPQTCESVFTQYSCELRPPEPGCNCMDNYLRNASGICIPSNECPPPDNLPPKCGDNEEETDNKKLCPPETCESLYKYYSCLPSAPEPGCKCIEGYLRNSSGVCIPRDKCPRWNCVCKSSVPVYNITCGPNEIKKDIKTVCPPQTCESLYSNNFCEPGYPEPGCDCVEGFLRNNAGVCISTAECPKPADYDDSYSDTDDGQYLDTETSSCESSENQYNTQFTAQSSAQGTAQSSAHSSAQSSSKSSAQSYAHSSAQSSSESSAQSSAHGSAQSSSESSAQSYAHSSAQSSARSSAQNTAQNTDQNGSSCMWNSTMVAVLQVVSFHILNLFKKM